MTFSTLSYVAIAVIATAVFAAWTRRMHATGALVIANIVVFVLELVDLRVQRDLLLLASDVVQANPRAALTVFTSAFVHADVMHIFGNMLLLFILGNAFEDRIGHRMIVVVYFATALAGALTEVALHWGEPLALLGASGAVFGMLGAFAGAYPNLVVPMPLPLLIMLIFVRMRVWIGAVVMGAMEYVYLMLFVGTRVAHGAHLGGLVMGILVGALAIRRRRPVHAPQPVDLRLLEPFAADAQTRDALGRMGANADEPAVFQAWLDRFFRSARCPTCGANVRPHHKGEVVCQEGHRFDVRARRQAPVTASDTVR